MKQFIPSHPRSLREWGQTLALIVIALPAFVGAMGVGDGCRKFLLQLLQTADRR